MRAVAGFFFSWWDAWISLFSGHFKADSTGYILATLPMLLALLIVFKAIVFFLKAIRFLFKK